MEPLTMNPLTQDLSILNKFNFERKPVGIKFLYNKPEGIKKLKKQMGICEMIGEAQNSEVPFYMTEKEEDCFGAVTLGMRDTPPYAEAGLVGKALGIFKEPRANSRLYNNIPKIHPGVVNYVLFAPLEKITFDPDLLIILADTNQGEILFRAIDYSTGGLRESKTTGVFGCSWIMTYPYQSGKINYTITGLGYGTKAKEVFPGGMLLISIPFDYILTLVNNLKEIDWELPAYKMGVDKFKEYEKQILGDLEKQQGHLK